MKYFDLVQKDIQTPQIQRGRTWERLHIILGLIPSVAKQFSFTNFILQANVWWRGSQPQQYVGWVPVLNQASDTLS